MRSVKAPRKVGSSAGPQLKELAEFAKLLDKNKLIAVNCDAGGYWLARCSGPAFPVPADMIHTTEQFEEGWLVVPARWYKLEQVCQRAYRLLEESGSFW